METIDNAAVNVDPDFTVVKSKAQKYNMRKFRKRNFRYARFTCTKNPPASMKVMTVTEAKVVALFKSISVAPIASPRPCKLLILVFVYILIVMLCS